jgi:hypothetical protein
MAPRSSSSYESAARQKEGGEPSDFNADGTMKTINNGRDVSEVREFENGVKLYSCVPTDFKSWPRWLRMIVGWLQMMYFVFLFLLIPISLVLLHPWFWASPFKVLCSSSYLGLIVVSLFVPLKEWPALHNAGQLWYEAFDVSSNLSPDERRAMVEHGNGPNGNIAAMHPHGIVPFQALLWAAYSEQYLQINEAGKPKKWLFGFAAAADVVFSLPLLRNLLGWFATHGASYQVLKNGLRNGISIPANNIGRSPKHLFILPGGVAEIFTSDIGKHTIVFKERKGVCKLAIECGSEITPIYIFGGTDFFHNLCAGDSWLAQLSRKYKIGLTLFWGWFYLPIPYLPKLTIAVGKSLPLPKGWNGQGNVPQNLIDEYHSAYLTEIQRVFDTYKSAAGYGDANLEII